MTFGNDLQDQVPAIVDYISDGIHSLNQFRNFVRDISHLERDYAQKLDNIAKKYKTAATKKQSESLNTEDNEWNNSTSTTSIAWYSMLEQTEMLAKTRFLLVEDLNNCIIEPAKAAAQRKEDAKKKRDKTYLDKDKAKQVYDDSCSEIETIQAKLNRTTGDKEKLQRHLDHAILECNNKKNSYLLSLSIANAEHTKYHEADIPALSDISKMDPEVDENIFIRDTLGSNNNNNDNNGNSSFQFIPYHNSTLDGLIDNAILSDSSIIFLNNILVKDRKKLDSIGDELSRKSNELGEEDAHCQSITDKASESYDIAKDRLMDISRQMTILSTQKARVKSEIDTIIHCIGDEGLRAQTHDFKPSSFTIPTTCDYCKSTIWGLSNKGMTCKVCGFNCHAKCEMKVAPNCSGVRGKINEQPSSSNINYASSIKSPTLTSAPLPSTSTQSTTSFTPSSITAASYHQQNNTMSSSSSFSNLTNTIMTSFVVEALYDYEAQNDDELSITEGEHLKVVGEPDGGWIKVQRESTLDYVVAIYDFEAVNADELNLKEGDRIVVTNRDESGWWEGVLNGQSGIFPSNYIQPA
ncbi:hypothetical protein BJ944DRAFT_256666 [Cunninghamella echinulata]|nr:hypothetical protein BJ944DRAFT_256666 [Cunninghamella echinulata]